MKSLREWDERIRNNDSKFVLPVVKLAEAAGDKVLRIFDRRIRNQRAIGVRVPGDQQRHSLFQLAAIEQHDLLVR